MTTCYAVTLHSPMGPRQGRLELTIDGCSVTGTLTLLGVSQPVHGEMTDETHALLTHHLRTAVSDMDCRSALALTQDTLGGTLQTGKQTMRWSGRLESQTA